MAQKLGALLAGMVLLSGRTTAANYTYTWTCKNATTVTGTWATWNGVGDPSVGECLKLPANLASEMNYKSTASILAKLNTTPPLIASFVPNATCGGLTIATLEGNSTNATSGEALVPPANFTCAAGQVPYATYDNPPSRITTTTGRGVGVPVSSCQQYGADWEEEAGLCYPPCNMGYSGDGPLCLTDCPANFPDQGLECGKPSSYGRGAGSIWGGADKVKWGGLWYPACAANFHKVGCCVCSPDCPAGTTDIGVSCQKGSYGRGVGQLLGCAAGQEYDAGLCYSPCPAGASGVGPLCYSGCTSDDPYRLGIWCYNSESERNEILGAIIGGVIAGAVLATVAAVMAPVGIAAATATAPITIDWDAFASTEVEVSVILVAV